MPTTDDGGGVFMNPGGDYRSVCGLCEWAEYDVPTLETAGHLFDLHRGDEHFDE